jgi:hypothetical protein
MRYAGIALDAKQKLRLTRIVAARLDARVIVPFARASR